MNLFPNTMEIEAFYHEEWPHNLPLKQDGVIGFWSREHEGEKCVHGLDNTEDQNIKLPYAKVNSTSVNKYSDTPVQGNFEYVQWRYDKNQDNYDV